MRHPEPARRAPHHRVMRETGTIENTGALSGEGMPINSVHVEDGGVRRQTGPDGGYGIVSRPVDDPGQRVPVRLFGQDRRARLGSRHDQAVEPAFPKTSEIETSSAQTSSAPSGTRDIR